MAERASLRGCGNGIGSSGGVVARGRVTRCPLCQPWLSLPGHPCLCCPLSLCLVPFAPCRSLGSPSPLLANVRELRFRMQLPHSTLPMLKVRHMHAAIHMAHSSAQVHGQRPLPALQQHLAEMLQQRHVHDLRSLAALHPAVTTTTWLP